MMKLLKRITRSCIERTINMLGYDVILGKKGVRQIADVDKKAWQPFFDGNDRVDLYEEAMKITDMESTDNFPRQLRFYSLQQSIQHVLNSGVPGDFAECGCWKGLSAYITCSYIKLDNQQRQFHVFDSFEGGLSDKSSEDENKRFGLSDEEITTEKLHFASTECQVSKALEPFDNFTLYKGWIPERFNEVDDRKFAFVNIDVDLYTPTKDSFEFFYPRMSKGGIMVCDDYNMTQFPGAKQGVDEFIKEKDAGSYFYEIPMGGCILVV